MNSTPIKAVPLRLEGMVIVAADFARDGKLVPFEEVAKEGFVVDPICAPLIASAVNLMREASEKMAKELGKRLIR